MNLELIKANDQDFGNTWRTTLYFGDGSSEEFIGERPNHFFGVFGLVNLFGDEYHIIEEDDGFCWTTEIVSKEDINIINEGLVKLLPNFTFKGNYKVSFNTKMCMKRKLSNGFEIEVKPRENTAPIILLKLHKKTIKFDVNWLESLIETTYLKG